MNYSEVRILSSKRGFSVVLPLRNGKTRTVSCFNLEEVLQLVCDQIGDRNRWKVTLVEKNA